MRSKPTRYRGVVLTSFFRGRADESQTFVFDSTANAERVQFDLESYGDRKEVHDGGTKRRRRHNDAAFFQQGYSKAGRGHDQIEQSKICGHRQTGKLRQWELSHGEHRGNFYRRWQASFFFLQAGKRERFDKARVRSEQGRRLLEDR